MAGIARRDFLKLIGAGAVLGAGWPYASAFANAKPHVVIVGGGVGGATAAKYLKLADAGVRVTVVERNPVYIRPYGSSEVLNGHIGMADLEVGYDALKQRYGIEFLIDTVTGVDPKARTITTAGGTRLNYDALIVSPGIQLRYDAIPGYSEEVANTRVPSGWIPGRQTALLAEQLRAMRPGGTFVIVPPPNPYRCPPGPYERGALMAEWFQRHNPTAKVLILDSKDNFVTDQTMMMGWNRLYGYNIPDKFMEGIPKDLDWPIRRHEEPGMIEWVPGGQGGRVLELDAKRMVVESESGLHRADVLNVIPPMVAGKVAFDMGLTDNSGWCPIDRRSHESTVHAGIYVIGDACIADAMPKSGFAANTQAKVVAQTIVDRLAGREPPEPTWGNTCYALAGSEYGLFVADVFRVRDGKIQRVNQDRYLPLDASRMQIRLGALYQQNWMRVFTEDCFA